jgi:hypothetical protein
VQEQVPVASASGTSFMLSQKLQKGPCEGDPQMPSGFSGRQAKDLFNSKHCCGCDL